MVYPYGIPGARGIGAKEIEQMELARMAKHKKQIMFNNSLRDICTVCKSPHGFCKHTIEKQYQDACPESPKDEGAVWQLVRSYAIEKTERRNLQDGYLKENRELRIENAHLQMENTELRHFKKHVEEILLNNLKDKTPVKKP